MGADTLNKSEFKSKRESQTEIEEVSSLGRHDHVVREDDETTKIMMYSHPDSNTKLLKNESELIKILKKNPSSATTCQVPSILQGTKSGDPKFGGTSYLNINRIMSDASVS